MGIAVAKKSTPYQPNLLCVCYRILCQFSSSNFYPYIRGLLLHTSPHVMGALNNTHMVPAPFSRYKCGMEWIHTRTFSALSCLYKKDLSIFTCFHCCPIRNISSLQAIEKQYFLHFLIESIFLNKFTNFAWWWYKEPKSFGVFLVCFLACGKPREYRQRFKASTAVVYCCFSLAAA